MVPDIKTKTDEINSQKFEFRKNFNTSRILEVKNYAFDRAHNSEKHFVRSLKRVSDVDHYYDLTLASLAIGNHEKLLKWD